MVVVVGKYAIANVPSGVIAAVTNVLTAKVPVESPLGLPGYVYCVP